MTGFEGKESRLFYMSRIEIIPDLSENDVRNIFFSFHSINADVFPLFKSLFKSGCIRIISDVNSRHPVLNLSKKSDQCLQVSNLHIGNDKKIQVFLPLDQRHQIF